MTNLQTILLMLSLWMPLYVLFETYVPRAEWKRVGGLTFVRLGRLRVQYSITRKDWE